MADLVVVRPVIVSCAVRYALGRRSYIVGDVVDTVTDHIRDLGDQHAVILADIEDHLANDDGSDPYVTGMWAGLANLLHARDDDQ